MNFKELLNIDNGLTGIDVYNDCCDDEGVAIVDPVKLKPEGRKKFNDLFGLEVEVELEGSYPHATVLINDRRDWKSIRRLLNSFLWAQAGYCSCHDYDRWFVEV